jgi:hypothetical protein
VVLYYDETQIFTVIFRISFCGHCLEIEYFALEKIDRTQETLIAENLIKTSPLHPGILRAELGL